MTSTEPPRREDVDRECNAALVEYAKEAFQEEHRRYEWSEAKTSRYLTVLTIVLGVCAVRIPDLVALGTPGSLLGWIFVVAFAVSFATAFGALLFAL